MGGMSSGIEACSLLEDPELSIETCLCWGRASVKCEPIGREFTPLWLGIRTLADVILRELVGVQLSQVQGSGRWHGARRGRNKAEAPQRGAGGNGPSLPLRRKPMDRRGLRPFYTTSSPQYTL